MPSPFPGMNPYLEQDAVWQDFHQSFIPAAREAISPQLSADYFIKVEEYVFIHELDAEARRSLGRADILLSTSDKNKASSTAIASAAPAYVSVPSLAIDEERHSFLEIRDRQHLELVTVVELLSPSNKSGADRATYLNKRRRLIESGVNLVELDLLRGGPRLPIDGLSPCDYYALVVRSEERPRGGIWAFQLREPLPNIPVPLRAPDPDVSLNLKNILDRVYDGAAYEKFIYLTPPQPALNADQEQWARDYLPKR